MSIARQKINELIDERTKVEQERDEWKRLADESGKKHVSVAKQLRVALDRAEAAEYRLREVEEVGQAQLAQLDTLFTVNANLEQQQAALVETLKKIAAHHGERFVMTGDGIMERQPSWAEIAEAALRAAGEQP